MGEYETVIQLIKDGMLETIQAFGKSEMDIGECIYKAKSKCDTICLDYIDLKSVLKEHKPKFWQSLLQPILEKCQLKESGSVEVLS